MTVDARLLRQKIDEARAENLMILYVDSFRNDGHETEFYGTPAGTFAQRRAFERDFLRLPETRRRVRQEFDEHVRYHVARSHWEVLYWLHDEFPARYLAGSPQDRLRELLETIERRSRAAAVNGHNGWDEVLQIPNVRRTRREQGAAEQQRVNELLQSAAETLVSTLNAQANDRMLRKVYQTGIARGVGSGSGNNRVMHGTWADAVVVFVQELDGHRRGNPSGRQGNSSRPVGHTAEGYMIDAARVAWGQLSSEQRGVLRDRTNWRRLLDERLWPAVRERINWGFRQSGFTDINVDNFTGGLTNRFRSPSQSIAE